MFIKKKHTANKNILLLIAFISFLFLLTSCNKDNENDFSKEAPYDFSKEEPFIIVTYSIAGPDTLINFYPTVVSMDVEGNVTLSSKSYSDIEIAEDAPKVKTKVSKSEVEHVQEMIESYKFWQQEDNISDNNSVDGDFTKITVNLDSESKTVGGLNPDDEAFHELAEHILYDYIDNDDFQAWKSEIKQYILDKNPDIQ